MLTFARVFQDGMVLQRDMQVPVWGKSSTEESVSVFLNGRLVASQTVGPGDFALLLPPMGASEDNCLVIGEKAFHHVDVGDVFIASGQSNMNFPLKYDQDGPGALACADDPHLRMYTVGQYSFPGERAWHYKDHKPWDRWLPFSPETGGDFSAAALYFARAHRKNGVPVGILHCSWSGTGIVSWLPDWALGSPVLSSCLEAYETKIQGLDLNRYWQVKRIACQLQFHPAREPLMGAYYRTAYPPSRLPQMTRAADMANLIGKVPIHNPEGLALSELTQEELTALGPGDPKTPGALYQTMVTEIEGYAARGVLWYQGEQDADHGEKYAQMFSILLDSWRRAWLKRNPGQTQLPFFTVQLAPFGTWKNSTGDAFPVVRDQQAVCRRMKDVYMISSSDVGNVFDVHPKEKRPLGERLARMAEKYLEGKPIPADAPEGCAAHLCGGELRVSFLHGNGLFIRPADFSGYNGFSLEMIPEFLRPPVLCGVNGLRILADGAPISQALCRTEGNQLIVSAPGIEKAHTLRLEFAQTAFYQVNLYNGAGLPALPFSIQVETESSIG